MIVDGAVRRRGARVGLAWFALVACSSKPRPEDAVHGGPTRDATAAAPGSATAASGSSDVRDLAPPPAGSAAGASSAASTAAGSTAAGSTAAGSTAAGSTAAGSTAAGSTAAGTSSAGASSAGASSAGASSAGGPVTGSTGDLQVRVVWPDVPVAARSSPARTPCNTPRAPSVAPTTTWGIPGALVIIEGATPPPNVARITLAECALVPGIAVGDSLAITSAVDRPAKLVLRKRGSLERLAPGDPVPVMLPIAGHTVTAALDAGSLYSLETDAKDPEIAFIAAIPSYVTDASGQVTVHHLAAGVHAVTAWLPPRAGQPARIGRGTATVIAGDLASLTLTLAP